MVNHYVQEVSNKLNLHNSNFLCCIGNGIGTRIFPHILNSVRGVVINENKIQTKVLLQKNPLLKDVRFVDNMGELDEGAFDRVIWQYDFNVLSNNFVYIMNKLVEITDNNGYVLMSEVAHADDVRIRIENWLLSRELSNHWFIENRFDRGLFDVLVRVKKYE